MHNPGFGVVRNNSFIQNTDRRCIIQDLNGRPILQSNKAINLPSKSAAFLNLNNEAALSNPYESNPALPSSFIQNITLNSNRKHTTQASFVVDIAKSLLLDMAKTEPDLTTHDSDYLRESHNSVKG